jgi:integrase
MAKAARRVTIDDRAETWFRRVAGDRRNEFEGAARSANTWKQYASAVNLFETWCKEHRRRPLPAKPETVKRWVLDLARGGYSNATIRAYVSALCTWHRLQGHSLDRTPLRETLKGIKRAAEPQRKVRPLLRDELAGILDMLDPLQPADARDGAMLSLGWANAMRRSELVGLDWQRKGAGSNATGVLSMTADGISVRLMRQKTKQEAVEALPDIPAKQMPAAMRWLALWADVADLKAGQPVFRAIISNRSRSQRVGVARLSDHSAADVVKRRMVALEMSRGLTLEEASDRAAEFSGHSLRAGYCTSAAKAGTPEYLIRQRSRHRSAETVARYVRAAETGHEHGLGKVGL